MDNILPTFSVVPKKTFLGFDKSKGHCFTVKKSLTLPFVDFFKLNRSNLQQQILLVIDGVEYPALLRLVIQDKSKPIKSGIERNWKYREVLSIGWKGKKDTIEALHSNLPIAVNLVSKGLKNNRELINFEHLGGNRFYISFNKTYL